MSSITDEVTGKVPDMLVKSANITLKAAKEAKEGIKDVAGAVKGICLLLGKGAVFSESSVMKVVRAVAFKKTGDIKFSKTNIDIAKLRESGHVYRVEENIVADVMKCFDKQCKKHGIKYSAMKDTRGDGKEGNKPSYMVFFEGRDTDTILSALQEAYKDYAERQKQEKEQDKSEKKKGRRDRKKDKAVNPENRESVKAKLAFFRDRVAARDAERDVLEKHHSHSDIQR